MPYPSELDARNTYATQNPGQNAGLTLGPNTPAGFEFAARLMQSGAGGFLAFFEAVMHETTNIGTYVLLLDQAQSPQVSAGQSTAVVDGDLALLTFGPTMAVGSIIVVSEPESQAPVRCVINGKAYEYRGFPFDYGCIAVLSSTPGRVTQLVGPNGAPPVGGARFTSRIQRCPSPAAGGQG